MRKPVRLPYDFGDVVYHRAKADRVKGLVTGFCIRDNRILIYVTWGDTRGEEVHNQFELTSEFEQTFNTE
jgi:hypothetical protein